MTTSRIGCALFACLAAFASPAHATPNDELMAACKAGNLEGARKAIEAGAAVNALDPASGNPALSAAFFWPDITRLLLEKGADPNLGAQKPLFQAAMFYSTEVMKLLLDAGADPNKPSLTDPAALFKSLIAAERGKGAAANQALIDAWTNAGKVLKPTEVWALPAAAGNRCAPCVEMMLAKGAKVDKGLGDGNLLHSFGGSLAPTADEWTKGFATTRSMLEGLGLKLPDWYGPVLAADHIGSADRLVKALVQAGVKINEKNKGLDNLKPRTPLEVALNSGYGNKGDVMLALVEGGADVTLKHEIFGPLILQAAVAGFTDVVKAMVAHGADINQQGSVFDNGSKTALLATFTPLTAAAFKDRVEVVSYLLGAGASSTAAVNGTITLVGRKKLGDAQAPVCLADIKGMTAIYFAIQNDNLAMVKAIVEGNGYHGERLSYSAKKMTNCIGGGGYDPSGYAKALGASKELIDYLASKNI